MDEESPVNQVTGPTAPRPGETFGDGVAFLNGIYRFTPPPERPSMAQLEAENAALRAEVEELRGTVRPVKTRVKENA